jgi:predicted DNA-binding transcriptional regulator AlpA
MFFLLGEKFYDQQSSISADPRFPAANVWYWTEQGLTRKQVPHEIWGDIMAMRACEYTLKLGGGSRGDDAVSLWLAANYKREADLPKDAKDTTRDENYPPAHYWGVQAGTRYLDNALGRALADHNSAVAYRAIRSMQEIGGQSDLFQNNSAKSLVDAMQYPDRKVRFEAALALAGALPQTKFEGQQRVIPLLAEAISQTGQVSVVLVLPDADAVNKLANDLKTSAGYAVAGATTPEAAISMAAELPAVDVIVVSDEIGNGNVDRLFNMANDNARLAGAARLVITKTSASIYEPRKVSEPLLSTTLATDAAGLKPAIDQARTKTGSLSLDPDVATQYAVRAGEMMIKVGISRGQVYDLMPAKQALLASLSDSRPEIVKLGGQVLALINDPAAQGGLLMTATDEKTTDDVKISLYKSLATSAKFFGNKLDSSQVQTLEKTVADAQNLEVRSAAAEARGALNLPADQAKSLIVKQSKI